MGQIKLICEKQSDCNKNFFENQFLKNLDKLLNLSHVKVVNGMTLKKKDTVHNPVEMSSNTCENNSWIEKIDTRIKRMMDTHVLEFDLASVVKPGKCIFIAKIIKRIKRH
jgi:hypothetical protein